MHQENIHVSWGVRADKLEVKRISDILGLQPTHAFEEGEEYFGRRSGLQKRNTGVWQYSTENIINSDNLDEHIQYILDKLENNKEFIVNWSTTLSIM